MNRDFLALLFGFGLLGAAAGMGLVGYLPLITLTGIWAIGAVGAFTALVAVGGAALVDRLTPTRGAPTR